MSPQALTAFRYGGHATFPVRYGWVAKGIEHVRTKGAFVPNIETADELGLGSKMVEALGFWLEAMALVETEEKPRSGPKSLSALAALVSRHDPYLELPVTWWFLHLSLCRGAGTVWSWFFNDYSDRVFDRATCTQAFVRHTRAAAMRPATEQNASKDVACLLNAYAARPGVDVVSPEDVGACPFRELGLVARHDTIGRFERTRSPTALPKEAFMACASLLSRDAGKNALSLRELATLRHGPGRIFCAGLPAIEALVGAASGDTGEWNARVVVLAGELHLSVDQRPATAWLKDAYSRIGARP